ncbi:hypothetical protein [Geobacter sp. SVR]|uniref:hypothetical protein n=1 Tax=Geobacter sp. SVR TaxID=2495594 RepID=UPI00143F00C5|nr:hypothetical protein [Geobacter sp. SVR]BCS53902.1 hypothetical protein GSVR_22100 [Geobacter sp. SVR]GCF86320.1 hypothetical protein GSbR_29200 [Geobacter sp. SVR]
MNSTIYIRELTDTPIDPDIVKILDELLERDENITARAVARLHPSIKAASSITRSKHRSDLLERYQKRQTEFRTWKGRLKKNSQAKTASALAEKDIQIAELERRVAMLTASHVAMLRAVGEMGGFLKWAQFYDKYRMVRDELTKLRPRQ